LLGKIWSKAFKIGLFLKQKYEIFRDISRIFRDIVKSFWYP